MHQFSPSNYHLTWWSSWKSRLCIGCQHNHAKRTFLWKPNLEWKDLQVEGGVFIREETTYRYLRPDLTCDGHWMAGSRVGGCMASSSSVLICKPGLNGNEVTKMEVSVMGKVKWKLTEFSNMYTQQVQLCVPCWGHLAGPMRTLYIAYILQATWSWLNRITGS
jgi:hypothetical protein